VPKIIENVRGQLLAEAKKQIEERGYAATTVRSVASACGVGVGTVYNYFDSKEMLIASFVYEDWKQALSQMQSLPCGEPRPLLKGLYDSLTQFAAKYEKLFSDSDAAKLAAVGSSDRHRMLRGQIASFVLPLCEANASADPSFTASFVAESLICWSMEGVDFDVIFPLLEKIIRT